MAQQGSNAPEGAADDQFDFIIVGSGAASVGAALAAKSRGLKPLIIEKLDKFGGSTAFSGGVSWLPLNPYTKEKDTVEKALAYFEATTGDVGPASSLERRLAFINNAPEWVDLFRAQGVEFVCPNWPDYYNERPGGLREGRSLIVPPFDLRELGDWQDKVGFSPNLPQIPLATTEYLELTNIKTSFKAKMLGLRIGWRMLTAKLLGRKLRASGVAFQGRLLKVALRENIPIWLSSPVRHLVVEDGRVVGVEIEQNGVRRTIRASRGVLLNTGGFSHNKEMRDKYQPFGLDPRWAWSNPGDTGDMLPELEALGAYTEMMEESWWVPGSMLPSGKPVFNVPGQSGKPHHIVVSSKGERIGNETGAYMEFGQRMIKDGGPIWAIIDSQGRSKYGWAECPPGITPKSLIEQGYFLKDDSIEGLAAKCGIDPAGLRSTIERFNGYARTGVDPEFGRGDSANNGYIGDITHKPNPALGTLEKAPYYAVRLVLTDVGTSGGVMTDEYARVVRRDGTAIPGIYATGNLTASVLGRCYLGAGASIGASSVFGYIAAKHAAGAND